MSDEDALWAERAGRGLRGKEWAGGQYASEVLEFLRLSTKQSQNQAFKQQSGREWNSKSGERCSPEDTVTSTQRHRGLDHLLSLAVSCIH